MWAYGHVCIWMCKYVYIYVYVYIHACIHTYMLNGSKGQDLCITSCLASLFILVLFVSSFVRLFFFFFLPPFLLGWMLAIHILLLHIWLLHISLIRVSLIHIWLTHMWMLAVRVHNFAWPLSEHECYLWTSDLFMSSCFTSFILGMAVQSRDWCTRLCVTAWPLSLCRSYTWAHVSLLFLMNGCTSRDSCRSPSLHRGLIY